MKQLTLDTKAPTTKTFPEIRVGAFVRSWDSAYAERRTFGANWVEGIVEAIGPVAEMGDSCERYSIRVTADFFNGRRVLEDGRVGLLVYPPVNGSVGTFGTVADGVEMLDRIDPTIWQKSETEGRMKPAGQHSVRVLVKAISAALHYEDMIDEYDALGLVYKYDGPDGRDADAPILPLYNFEISPRIGGSEGHYVQVRLQQREDYYGSDDSSIIYTVKTFRGLDHALAITKKLVELLDV